MADATRTLYHPTLPTAYDVPTADVEGWKEQGWRVTPIGTEQAEAVAETVTATPAKK